MIWMYVVIVCLGVVFYVGVGLLISELISKRFLKEPSQHEWQQKNTKKVYSTVKRKKRTSKKRKAA